MELRIQSVSRSYANGVQALARVSLSIGRGVFGLLGENGAGKSTLMRILATLQKPDEGTLHLGDIDIVRQPNALRANLGYLPQSFGVYPNTTARALLEHVAELKGFHSRNARRRAVDAALEQVNLSDRANERLGAFSGGMKQRFGIAQALLGNPQLIIVDEPTAGLDPAERNRFYNLLSQASEQSIVLLSTHIVEDVTSLCSEMAVLHRGEILLHDSPPNAIARFTGKIWARTVNHQEARVLSQQLPLVSTHFFQGQQTLRVLSESQPAPDFVAHPPTLEDAYFALLHQRRTAESSTQTPTAHD